MNLFSIRALLFIFVVLISFVGGFLGSYFVLDGGVRYVDDGSGIITSNDDLDDDESIYDNDINE